MVIDSFANALASIQEEAANIFLEGSLTVAHNKDQPLPWEEDRTAIGAALGTDEPHEWLYEAVASCLAEAANQLLATASLMRHGRATASLEPLVRAIVERVGVVNWALDNSLAPKGRAARASLNMVVSLQHYREAMARLEGDEQYRKALRAQRTKLDEFMVNSFSIVRPPTDPADATSKPTADATQWVVEGETYPTLTRLFQMATARGGTPAGLLAGTYDGLSGFAHPSFFYNSKRRSVGTDATVVDQYRPEHLEKLSRLATLSYLDGLFHWVGYYMGNADEALISQLNGVGQRFDGISVLGTEGLSVDRAT